MPKYLVSILAYAEVQAENIDCADKVADEIAKQMAAGEVSNLIFETKVKGIQEEA